MAKDQRIDRQGSESAVGAVRYEFGECPGPGSRRDRNGCG
jgi:hypothetical protein